MSKKEPRIMSKKEPRVLVAIPTNSFKLQFYSKLRKTLKGMEGNFDIIFSDDSPDDRYAKDIISKDFEVFHNPGPLDVHRVVRIVKQRNFLIREFLKRKKYSHLLFLDSDVIPPYNVIPQLLSHDKDVTTAICFARLENQGDKLLACVFTPLDEEAKDLRLYSYYDIEALLESTRPEILKEITSLGMGCVLLSRKVVEDVNEFKFDIDFSLQGEDTLWCEEVIKKGYNMYADTSCLCQHFGKIEKEREFNRIVEKALGGGILEDGTTGD